MPYSPSTPPDWTESIPFPLSLRTTVSSAAETGFRYDVYIGGLPFLLPASDRIPYSRATLPSTKKQLDTSNEPGEHSLSTWWTRDQTSWHRGSGVNYYEPGTDSGTIYRSNSSVGVDVWTRGSARLIRRMNLVSAGTAGSMSNVASAVVGGSDVVFMATDTELKRWSPSSTVTYTVTGSGPTTKLAVAGDKVLAGSASGILSGDTGGSTASVLWTTTTSVAPTPYWVKGRIIASRGNSLYELTLAGGSFDSVSALYSHPNSSWTWTDVTEAPGAILASGYSDGTSFIYAFRLIEGTTSGSTPTIGAAVQVAEFPPGERVYSIKTYLGRYIAIGTNRGVRIGAIDASGSIDYGPITVETSTPVRSITTDREFFYASVEDSIDGSSGAVRICLSEEIPSETGSAGTGRFAWAWDVQTHTPGVVTSVAVSSGRVALGVTSDGVYIQSSTVYETSGYIKTGKIRFDTTEPKLFRLVRVDTDIPGDSNVAMSTTDQDGNTEFNFSISGATNTRDDMSISAVSTMQSEMAFTLMLYSSSSGTSTPVVNGFQVKAIPCPRVQRSIKIPIMVYDHEKDSRGNTIGRDGWGYERLAALEELEETAPVVLVKDVTTGDSFTGRIDSIDFQRTTPRTGVGSGFGGVAMVTMVKL